MQVKSRHHLRADVVADLEDSLSDALGVDLHGDTYEKVELEGDDPALVLVDGELAVMYVEREPGTGSKPSDEATEGQGGEEPFLTVRGANAYEPTKRVVTVDAGAISFVSDGADVMRPGIVEADPDIEAGDLVLVAEETHGKVLAVGRARTSGDDMVGDSGKVVDSVHHVGDDLYEFSV